MLIERLFRRQEPAVGIRALHLDLKGLPPTFEHLLELLDIIAAARYNALLVEWEDMFPWQVDGRFQCATAYSPGQVRRLTDEAGRRGIEVIPLVQCLGHLEWVLTPAGRESLREVPDRPDVLNPLADGARELIETMVLEVLEATGPCRHFHLGGDEAWSFGTHPDTRAFIEQQGKGALYLHHIEPLLELLDDRGVRPLLWHDMMIDWSEPELARLAGKADLIPWGYHDDPATTEGHFAERHIRRFAEAGLTLWAGGAYKGATAPTADLPDLPMHERNTLAWMRMADRYNFRGFIATAWSRFAGHVPQCEPIDACLDSLLNVGILCHDALPPAGGIEACRQALAEFSPSRHFAEVHAALREFSQKRSVAWRVLKETAERKTLQHRDPRRQSPSAVSNPEVLQQHIEQFASSAEAVRNTLAGRVPDCWIEEYIEVRLDALRNTASFITAGEHDPVNAFVSCGTTTREETA